MNNSPFKFLDPFKKNDKTVFFGRDEEIEALRKLVYKSPILLVYGYSGTGKTSLINCGLANQFSDAHWMPFNIRRNDNINDSLLNALKIKSADMPPETDIYKRLDTIFSEYFRPIYLIFDQFEELFVLGSKEEQTAFIEQVKKILALNIPIKIIIIIREEYLGSLYQFEKDLPLLFNFKFRVEQMNLEKVKQVINTSFEKFNITTNSPKQIDQIIEKVRHGNLGIQLPYLQVYLDELYEEDFARTYPGRKREENSFPEIEITTKEINQFGEIEDVLERFLQKQEIAVSQELISKYPNISEEHIRELMGNFITDEGTKKPINYRLVDGKPIPSKSFLKELPIMSTAEISDSILALDKKRIIRLTDDTIELAHDSLASIIYRLRDHDLLKLKEVKNQLNVLYATYLQSGSYLSKKRLNYFEKYLPLITLPQEVDEFIELSRKAIFRKRTYGLLGGATVALGIAALVFFGLSKVTDLTKKISGLHAAVSKIKEEASKLSATLGFQKTSTDVLEQATINPTIAMQKAENLLSEAIEKGYGDSLSIVENLLTRLSSKQHIQPIYTKEIALPNSTKKTRLLPVSDTSFQYYSLLQKGTAISGQLLNTQFEVIKDTLYQAGIELIDFELIKYKNEQLLAGITSTGSLYIWDLSDHQLKYKARFKKSITSIATANKDGLLYVGTDTELILIRTKDGQLTRHPIKKYPQRIKQISSNPTTNHIAILLESASQLYLLNPFTLDEEIIRPMKGGITDFDFSKNGQQLVIAYDNGKASVWNIATHKAIRNIHPNSYIQSVRFSPDNQFVLTGDYNAKVQLWDQDGVVFKEMIGHKTSIQQVAFIKEDLVVSTAQKNIKIWDVSSLAEQSYDFPTAVKDISIAPNSTSFVACDKQLENAFYWFDTNTQQRKKITIPVKKRQRKGKINALSLLNDKEVLLGSDNHLAYLYNLEDSSLLEIYPIQTQYAARPISLLTMQDSLLAIGQPKYISIRKRGAANRPYQTLFHTSTLKSICFNPLGNSLYAGYQEGSIIAWELGQGIPKDTLIGHTSAVTALQQFSIKEQNFLVSGSTDNAIVVWKENELGQFKSFQVLRGHLGDITALDFSPTLNKLLSASTDKSVKLWKWNGQQFVKQASPIRHLKAIPAAQFSADGKSILTAGADKRVKRWKVGK